MNDDQIKEVMRLADEIADYAWKEGLSDGAYSNAKQDRECRAESRAELEAYLRTIGEPESVNAELLEALKDARHCIGIDRDTLVDCHTNPCTGYLDPDGALAKAEYDDVIDAADAAIARAESAIESSSKPCAFRLGDLVKKVSGSAWEGRIVGTYITALTPEGYAVESASHPGSVQIYPAKALTLVIQEAGIQPTEGQHAQHVDVSGENVNATFRISKQTGADALVGLRGCNRRHGGMRAVEPCGYRMRTTDPGCTGCVERDEDQHAEAGGLDHV